MGDEVYKEADCPYCMRGYYVTPDGTPHRCYSCDAWSCLSERAEARARSEVARRVGADGLRRIGVAVAVWAGMAAERERATGVIALSLGAARCDSARAQRMHRIALDLAADLDAERADRRKWELRLRWRAQHGPRDDLFLDDRCHNHLGSVATVGLRPRRQAMLDRSRVPIAGPLGVLP